MYFTWDFVSAQAKIQKIHFNKIRHEIFPFCEWMDLLIEFVLEKVDSQIGLSLL